MSLRQPPPGHIDVGRSTIYGNPYRIGQTYVINNRPIQMLNAGSTIPHYEAYARARCQTDPSFHHAIILLRNRKLWCPGCGTSSPTCHARVLERLAKELPS